MQVKPNMKNEEAITEGWAHVISGHHRGFANWDKPTGLKRWKI